MTARLDPIAERQFTLPATFAWIDVVEFSLEGAATDVEVLSALIEHPRYDDTYMARWTAERTGTHGRYRLDALHPEVFRPVIVEQARLTLRAWASDGDPEVATSPAFADLLDDVLPPGGIVYSLPPLPSSAEHELAFVVGSATGFHEFVVISPRRDRVSLIVATDD